MSAMLNLKEEAFGCCSEYQNLVDKLQKLYQKSCLKQGFIKYTIHAVQILF